jgi:hypothetical protein
MRIKIVRCRLGLNEGNYARRQSLEFKDTLQIANCNLVFSSFLINDETVSFSAN